MIKLNIKKTVNQSNFGLWVSLEKFEINATQYSPPRDSAVIVITSLQQTQTKDSLCVKDCS